MTTKNKPNEGGRRGRTDRSKRKPAKPHEMPPAKRTIDLLERVNDGIVAFDAEMNYTYVNPRGAELLGRKPGDLIGKNYWVEFPEAKGTPFAEAYLRALETQEVMVIEDYYAPWERWFENRIYPSKDGLTIFFTEITARKGTELKLRASQERLELAIRSANVGLWDWDLLTNKVYYSPEWKSQLGYEDHEISNDFSEWESRVHPEDLERAKATISGYIEKPYPNFQNEFRMRHKDGSYRWILAQASLMYDEQGKPIRMIGSHIDITERKRAEERLGKSEQMLAEAQKIAHLGSFEWDVRTNQSIWSDELYRLYGLEPGSVNPNFDLFLERIHPEDRERVKNETWRAVQERRPLLLEERVVHPNGAERILFTQAYTETDTDGNPLRLVGACLDITDRKQAEDALRQSEEIHRIFSGMTSDYVYVFRVEPDGRVMNEWVSDSIYRVIGYSPEKYRALDSAFETIHQEDRALTRQMLDRVLAGEPVTYEARTVTESGDVRWLRNWIQPRWDNQRQHVVAFYGAGQDITERKRAEEALQRNERVLRLFVEHSPAAIAMFDREMKYIVASRRYLTDYDLGEQNVIGRSHYEVFPEIPERWKEIHRRCLAGGIEKADEDPFPRLSGKLDWIRWEIHPWYETNGEVGGLILFSEVITERKQARDELRLSRDRLADLSRRLVEAHETERRAIGRELHDQIGQMLTALKLTIEIAVQLPPEEALKKAAQGKELVEDLLNRVSALSLELRPPMLDDLGLLPALLWHVNRFQEQSGVEVEFKHSGIENRRFDPQTETTAYRIVQESLTNVARHARANRVRLEVRIRGEAMEIQIEDDGAGFDPQVALALNRGLSGMRERVQLVGGIFQIESETGKGARKFIRLPLREETT